MFDLAPEAELKLAERRERSLESDKPSKFCADIEERSWISLSKTIFISEPTFSPSNSLILPRVYLFISTISRMLAPVLSKKYLNTIKLLKIGPEVKTQQ